MNYLEIANKIPKLLKCRLDDAYEDHKKRSIYYRSGHIDDRLPGLPSIQSVHQGEVGEETLHSLLDNIGAPYSDISGDADGRGDTFLSGKTIDVKVGLKCLDYVRPPWETRAGYLEIRNRFFAQGINLITDIALAMCPLPGLLTLSVFEPAKMKISEVKGELHCGIPLNPSIKNQWYGKVGTPMTILLKLAKLLGDDAMARKLIEFDLTEGLDDWMYKKFMSIAKTKPRSLPDGTLYGASRAVHTKLKGTPGELLLVDVLQQLHVNARRATTEEDKIFADVLAHLVWIEAKLSTQCDYIEFKQISTDKLFGYTVGIHIPPDSVPIYWIVPKAIATDDTIDGVSETSPGWTKINFSYNSRYTNFMSNYLFDNPVEFLKTLHMITQGWQFHGHPPRSHPKYPRLF